MDAEEVYLLEVVVSESDRNVFVFTDRAWADWLDSKAPRVPTGEMSVRLDEGSVPAALIEPMLASCGGDGFPALHAETYRDDKVFLVAGAAKPIEPADQDNYKIIETFTVSLH